MDALVSYHSAMNELLRERKKEASSPLTPTKTQLRRRKKLENLVTRLKEKDQLPVDPYIHLRNKDEQKAVVQGNRAMESSSLLQSDTSDQKSIRSGDQFSLDLIPIKEIAKQFEALLPHQRRAFCREDRFVVALVLAIYLCENKELKNFLEHHLSFYLFQKGQRTFL